MRKLLFFCCVLVGCLSVAQAQTPQLDKLSLSINEELMSLKMQTESLQIDLVSMSKSLAAQSENLKISESERQRLLEQSNELHSSLESINEELNSSYLMLNEYKMKLTTLEKTATTLIIILIILIACKIVGYWCYLKHIKLPRLVDILL